MVTGTHAECRRKNRIALFLLLVPWVALGEPPRSAPTQSPTWIQYEVSIAGVVYSAYVIVPPVKTSLEFGIRDQVGNTFRRYEQLLWRVNAHSNVASEMLQETLERGTPYAETLIERAQAWLLSYYEKRGLFRNDHDGSMRKTFETVESLRNGQSGFVLITSKDNPSDIQAMMRLAIPTDAAPQMPLEQRLNIQLPRDESNRPQKVTEVVWSGDRPSANNEIGLHTTQYEREWFGGGVAELKNYAVNPEVAADLIPYLWMLAEVNKLTVYSGLRAPATTAEADVYGLSQLTFSEHGPVSEWLGAGASPKAIGKRVTRYWLECDVAVDDKEKKLLRVYEKLGFQVVRSLPNPDMPASETYVMSLEREPQSVGPDGKMAKSSFLIDGLRYIKERAGHGLKQSTVKFVDGTFRDYWNYAKGSVQCSLMVNLFERLQPYIHYRTSIPH